MPADRPVLQFGQMSRQAMTDCRDAARKSAARTLDRGDRKRGDDRQGPQRCWRRARHLKLAGRGKQSASRGRISAMVRSINQRPKLAGRLRQLRLASKQVAANPEQDSSAKPQSLDLRFSPGKRLEQWQPCVLELRQQLAAYSPDKQLALHGPQPRFGRRGHAVAQLLQSFAPPGKTDRSKPRIAARCHDIGKGEVKVPQRQERGFQFAWQLLERDLAVVIEPALSDSRRP